MSFCLSSALRFYISWFGLQLILRFTDSTNAAVGYSAADDDGRMTAEILLKLQDTCKTLLHLVFLCISLTWVLEQKKVQW